MRVLLVYIMMVACMCDSVKVKTLYLDEELKLELIREGQSNYYQLIGVEGGGTFEAKVSYPSSYPTNYQLTFIAMKEMRDGTDSSINYVQVHNLQSNENVGGRELLNADKIIFKVRDGGAVSHPACSLLPSGEVCVLEVRAYAEGVSVKVDTRTIERPYNLMLERVHLGGIPQSSFKVMAFIALVFILLIFVIVPAAKRFIPSRILDSLYGTHRKE